MFAVAACILIMSPVSNSKDEKEITAETASLKKIGQSKEITTRLRKAIIAVDGNPLQDINSIRRIISVFKDGHQFV